MQHAKDIFLSILRNKTTNCQVFREAATQLTHLLAHEVLQHLPTQNIPLETPLAATQGITITTDVILMPILRSGITMLPTFISYVPQARIAVIGARRDEETAEAHLYYQNIPPHTKNTRVIILDPMIATGGTGLIALSLLKTLGIPESNIIFCSIICAPEGINKLKTQFPPVIHVTAAIDDHLNARKFIVPGIGDFGDRYFGTEG